MSDPAPNQIDPELARLIIEGADEMAIFTFDAAGKVLSWNPGAEKIFGWTATEAIRTDAELIFTPEDRQDGAPAGEMQRAAAEGRAVDEGWHLRRDGSRFWASGLLMPLNRAGVEAPRAFVKIMRDRTAEHEAEQRANALTAVLPGFIFFADADGLLVETNQLFQDFTGREGPALQGERWLEALHEDDRAAAHHAWRQAIEAGEAFQTRFRVRRHDGEYCWHACRAVAERDAQGRIVRWLGTCLDVDDEVRARMALERLALALEQSVAAKDADLASAIESLETALAERKTMQEALNQAQKTSNPVLGPSPRAGPRTGRSGRLVG